MSIFDLAPSSVPKSPDITFIRGGFAFENSQVPYFATTLQASVLNGLLRLPSQIPVDMENPIELKELFQRELDEKRVESQIVPYLRATNRLRFFNALTVVLLPAVAGNTRRLAREYPEDDNAPPSPTGDFERTAIGPIALSHPPGNGRFGYLSWNTDATVPVVLDGQHRFRAMQRILADPAGRLQDDLAKAEVSVLFLILDPRAGFAPPPGRTVLGACREIFIDINKHARVVPRTRLFLLDDRDVTSVAMREILADSVKPEDRTVEQRVSEKSELPLGLVDWRGSTAKFDRTPYVTSLLTLHDIVDWIANVPKFDPLDYQRARQAVDTLTARFGLEDHPDFPNQTLLDEIDRAEAEERPFELDPDRVKIAAEAFASRFGARIVLPLTRLTPYAELISALEATDVLGSSLEPWLSFNSDERRGIVDQLGLNDPTVDVNRAWQTVKEAYPLAFQVVFQKASLYALNALVARGEPVASALGADDEDGSLLTVLIARFNAQVALSLAVGGTDSAFLGAGIRGDGTVDFRKTRIRAITGFIVYLLLAPFDDWLEEEHADREEVVRVWITEKWGLIAPGPRDPMTGLYSFHGKNWRNSVDDVVLVEEEEFFDEGRSEARIDHAVLQMLRALEAVEGP